jgi:SAM-dependent methyltransferase
MKPSPALGGDAVDRLRAAVAAEGDADVVPPPPAPPAPSGARAKVKGLIRRAIAWYVDPTAVDAADRAADRVREEVAVRLDEHQRRLDAGGDAEVRALTINLELLKAELRGLQLVLDELGAAIAPAAGLEGARERMAELRERVNSLERRSRPTVATPPSPPSPPASSPPAAVADATANFDYVGFERRFRGAADIVTKMATERYLPLLAEHPPVLDIGCGRGELVAALGAAGVEASGVDLDGGMVEEAVARGLDVRRGDAIEHLRSLADGSLGAIVSLHLIEHLQLGQLLELLELSAQKLRAGGVFVAETPNPASLIVLGNSYVLDPTHVRPLHPSLMVFLCEGAGFRDVELQFYAPAEGYHLPLVDDPEAPSWVATVNASLEKLNQTLFGPQEYAVVATRAPGSPDARA